MIEVKPNNRGVVDLTAYRKKIQEKEAVEPPESLQSESATTILKVAAARIIAAEQASSGAVTSLDLRRLLKAAYDLEKNFKKLLFDKGMDLPLGFEGALEQAIPMLSSVHQRYKDTYPGFAEMDVGDYAEDLAMFGYRSFSLTVELTRDGGATDVIEKLKDADTGAVVERLCGAIRSGKIPAALVTLSEVYLGGENSDSYNRMDNYYSYSDFNMIERDMARLVDVLPNNQAAMVLKSLCDGFSSLMIAMPSLAEYSRAIQSMIEQFEEKVSTLTTDVTTIAIDEEDRQFALSGYKSIEEGYLEWPEYAQAKFGIDHYAAKRLSSLIESNESSRIYNIWFNSPHRQAINELAAAVSNITNAWSIEIPGDAKIHDHSISLFNGDVRISVNLERINHESWDGPFKLQIHTASNRSKIDHRSGVRYSDDLTIQNYTASEHLALVLDKVASEVLKHDTGFNWAKVAAFKSADVDERSMNYAQQVKADLTKAIDEGILPSQLKITAACPYYRTVKITIAGLPEECPVYTPQYISFKKNEVNNNYERSGVEGYMYSSAYSVLLKAIEVIADARRYCYDDGYGSDYGAQHNYSSEIQLKASLENEALMDSQKAEHSDSWSFPSNAFNQTEALTVWDVTFEPNKRLSLSACKDIYRSVYHNINDISGMTSREIGLEYRRTSLALCHQLVTEADKRMPVKMDSERNQEMREMIDSCKTALAKKFGYCALTRFRNDVKDTINVGESVDLEFSPITNPARKFRINAELGPQSQLNGTIQSIRVSVVTDTQDSKGEAKSIVVAERTVDPYNSTQMLEMLGDELAESIVEVPLAMFAMGVLKEHELIELIKERNYSAVVRDAKLIPLTTQLPIDYKGLLCFADKMAGQNYLSEAQAYLAKLLVAAGGKEGSIEMCVLPRRGFCLTDESRATTVFIDNKFYLNLDEFSFKKLQSREFPDANAFITSTGFVDEYLGKSNTYKVDLTTAQRQWAQKELGEWELKQPTLKLYALDGGVLNGAIIRKGWSDHTLVTPEGDIIRLNESQDNRIRNLLATSAIQITHEDIALKAEQNLTMDN